MGWAVGGWRRGWIIVRMMIGKVLIYVDKFCILIIREIIWIIT